MSGNETIYLLDSNILIAAKRLYYAFDLCPGFWDTLLQAHADGRVLSTQRVYAELGAGKDDLLDWVTDVLQRFLYYK